MKNVWKVIVAILALFGALVGTLVIVDKIKNKNRIKGEYLECDDNEDIPDIDEQHFYVKAPFGGFYYY